ncbi:MAG: response regulator [Telluria sp.]
MPDPAPPAAQPDQSASGAQVRVLMVDDQPIVIEAIRRALSDEADIEFHYVTDAGAAAAAARDCHASVILQDLVMPDIDGFDAIRQYRADPVLRNVPVIVLSAREDQQVKAHSFSVGANDYLVKMPDRAELLARLRYHSACHLIRLERDDALRQLGEARRQLAAANAALQAAGAGTD